MKNEQARKFSTRVKIAASASALAIVGVGAFGTMAASAQPQAAAPQAAAATLKGKTTTTTNHLTIDAASTAAQAALKAAQKEDQRVTVAVVDRNGNTMVTLRGDGAGPQSYESAIKKAWTAAAWNAPTSALVQRLKDAPTLADIPNTLFLAGGVPVAHDNAPIAGIGVAGAPSGALDEKFARAGLAAIDNGR
ncbi:GlcG/HbpS family heme-binding protein [Actinomadura sediminis]|uniref:Heme-binding protein n=1 Tax=Actinomadura sediminis TaxID=1038904 RepID=A0ABW3ELH4_9ACTN